MIVDFILFLLVVAIFSAAYIYRLHFYSWYIDFPKPQYSLKLEKNVKVPMHDGVLLVADIYRPKEEGKFPILILRTPYGKSGNIHPYKMLAYLFVSQGYVFIVQDVRGKYLSEGDFDPYQNEGRDGFTTIEWAGKEPWSNGKVALYGFSYLGSCAWLSVPFSSPYLKTIVPMFTTQNTYSIFINKGMFHLKGALSWLSVFFGRYENHQFPFKRVSKVLMKLPVNSLDTEAVGQPIKPYQDYLKHIVPDDFWAQICVNQRMSEVDIPALILTGWYDTYLQDTIDDFNRMVDSPEHSKNPHSCIIIGPWAHNPSMKFEGVEYGRKAEFNLQLIDTLKWCDFWLKSDASPQDISKSFSKVKYFIMGKNEWHHTTSWPPPDVIPQKLYLTSETQRRKCIYKLLKTKPEEEIQTHYTYDPNNPVPFRGKHHLHDPAWTGPFEQGELTCRPDVITYVSEPLKEELTIAGVVKLVLYASSSALDTDFCAKICDMRPDGLTYNLQAGFVRMRYRESLHMPLLIEPGKIYRLEISLRSVAHTFFKNHRIQLQITSSDFPVHDRNLNTGLSPEFSTEIKVAQQTIHTGGLHPSHLILPTRATRPGPGKG